MRSIHDGRIIILGAGPTGLGAATMLYSAGYEEWQLFEGDKTVGGLSKSYLDEKGFTWDVGGHVVFSHYDVFTQLLSDLLGADGWIEHVRESWIRISNTWVPYPFQNNLHRLPASVRADCLEGLIRAAMVPIPRKFANFEDFILRVFGKGVADVFMIPYNFKVWGYHPSKMAAEWIGERVAVPDAARMARNVALDVDDANWGPNSTFRFPRRGGTGAIWNALVGHLPQEKIVTDCPAVEIDVEAKKIRFSNGLEESYDTLISTVSLKDLARMCRRKDWMELASGLLHSSSHIVGLGLRGPASPQLATKYWTYFPEDNCLFHRLIHLSLYSPETVDDISRHWSLIAEVSESPDRPVDQDKVVAETIEGLLRTGIIEEAEEVVHTWYHRVEYGYPTPSCNRDEILNKLLTDLYEKGILSRGRFGAWKYEVSNMDHSFMQGMEAASHLLCGSPELTVWNPGFVNTRHPVLGWKRLHGETIRLPNIDPSRKSTHKQKVP